MRLSSRHFSRKISIETNQQCNLKCVYCYEEGRSNRVFNIDKIKEILSELLSKRTHIGTIIDLHGGEPFLIFEQIKELCDWLWENEFQEKFLVHITTNGTLINDTIKNWLQLNKERIIIKLSIDGNKIAHNINRCNSFDSIDLLFFLSNWQEEGVKMTVSPQTVQYIYDSIVFLHNFGFEHIQTDIADIDCWSKHKKVLPIFKEQMKLLNAFYLTNSSLNKTSLYNISFNKYFDKSCDKYCKTCLNGSKVGIDIDGNKYPCHIFFPSVCGQSTIKDFGLYNIQEESTFLSGKCLNCSVKHFCLTCYGTNLLLRGEIAKRDMGYCEMEKIRIASIFKYHYNRIILTEQNHLTAEDYQIMMIISDLQEFIHNYTL